jgi:hypothetical protein
VSFLTRLLDERFFAHRRRSTSIAGITSAALALVLFEYRFLRFHVWDWNLFAIGLTFVAMKLALMTWYYLTD